ncbi:enamine deaminase RidA [Candidatus Marinamargulisbacteria bacterium SCGC AG-410-N11]|nr:enamine deaminase RidA [Candidatus Marinamargulisbacteria bacterium SCGC AG-410-N11]
MKKINTNNAPQPLGHYEQAIVYNGIVYVSGQLPLDMANNLEVPTSIEEQTELTLKNLEKVLIASNSSRESVLKTTIFISDISYWAKANEIYKTFFGDHKPARSAVPTKDLPKGCLIEIEAIAAQLG